MIRNVEAQVRHPFLGVESNHLGGMIFLECPRTTIPNAPKEITALWWRANTAEENDCHGRTLIPLEHDDQGFLEHDVICFVDVTCITPYPIESSVARNLAEHLELVMGEGLLEIIHDNVYDVFERGLVLFPLV